MDRVNQLAIVWVEDAIETVNIEDLCSEAVVDKKDCETDKLSIGGPPATSGLPAEYSFTTMCTSPNFPIVGVST
jgi:hypothetical protein